MKECPICNIPVSKQLRTHTHTHTLLNMKPGRNMIQCLKSPGSFIINSGERISRLIPAHWSHITSTFTQHKPNPPPLCYRERGGCKTSGSVLLFFTTGTSPRLQGKTSPGGMGREIARATTVIEDSAIPATEGKNHIPLHRCSETV